MKGCGFLDAKIDELLAKNSFDINDLCEIVTILRSENGCPWDKVQTHKTIKKDFLEEVYEVMEAIDCDNPDMMREELGDVLLQVVFHTNIEDEAGHFGLEEVVTDVCKKLIVRHPHVFGDVKADTVGQVLTNWDSIKMETKGQETYSDTLDSVPKNFPALMRAQKLGKRSAKARADFANDESGRKAAWSCVNDEIVSLHETLDCSSEDEQREALGDMIFSCCNMARAMGLDAEEVLSESSERFIERFKAAEKEAEKDGKELNGADGSIYDAMWRRK